ncbi:MAG: hypothetical protein IPL55_20465 [Saprospiraceae bacterium]|nr:hypothetical protein [Saprospiraceae bacterium]
MLHVKLKEESPSENNLPGTRTINGQQKIQIKVNDIDLTCHVKNNNVISGIKTIEMVPQPLFKYTPVKLKNYFKEKELIVASVSILSENKSKKLRISLKLISKDASKNYGYIPIDGLLRILFISGKKIDLYGLRNARGETELYTGNIVYTADYSLSDDDANALSDIPLDNIGMMWSSGFETYTIYNVDVIMNQLSCLKKLLN